MKNSILILAMFFTLFFVFLNTANATEICDESAEGTNGLVPCGKENIGSYKYEVSYWYSNLTWRTCPDSSIIPDDAPDKGALCRAYNRGRIEAGGYFGISFSSTSVTVTPPCESSKWNCTTIFSGYYRNNTIHYVNSNSVANATTKAQEQEREWYPTWQFYIDRVIKIGDTVKCRCELAHLFILILNVYDFILWDIATPLAVLLMAIGGVMLIVSAGNPGLAGTAKKIMWGAAIGILLLFGAWLIINIVLQAIGYTSPWWAPF